MHGQAKVKTSADEQEKKRKIKLEKVKQYRIRMDRFYAKRTDSIYDEETVNMINEILLTHPDVASLWNYKREILLHFLSSRDNAELAKILDNELKVTEGCLRVNPKSYCSWYHREWLLVHFPNPNLERELKLCTAYLKLDDRNFHCWDYRRWIVEKSGVSDKDELDYTTSKIEDNFSNYSAWHSRSKLLPRVHPHPSVPNMIHPDIQLSELDLVVNAAFTDPNDQSAWFYQRWLVGCGSARPGAIPVAAVRTSNRIYVALADPTPASNISVTCSQGSLQVSKVNPSILFVDTSTEEDEINVSIKGSGQWMLKFNERGVWEIPEIPEKSKPAEALVKVLSDQLTSCNELLALEPDSKWTLLASVNLMLAIDKVKYFNEVTERLNKLKEVDPYRINYYSDLLSSEMMEKVVRQCWPAQEVSLRDLGLRSLPWSHYLLSVVSVDLSNNSMSNSSLPALAALLLCKKLKLNGNKITSLNRFPPLENLEALELENNCIDDCEAEINKFFKALPNLSNFKGNQNPASETMLRVYSQKNV